MSFAIYSPKGQLLGIHDAPEEVLRVARTRWAGQVGWIERTSDHALIGAPGGIAGLKKEDRLALVQAWQRAHPAPVAPPAPPAPEPPPPPFSPRCLGKPRAGGLGR